MNDPCQCLALTILSNLVVRNHLLLNVRGIPDEIEFELTVFTGATVI